MMNEREIVKSVLDNTKVEHLITVVQVEELTEELITALTTMSDAHLAKELRLIAKDGLIDGISRGDARRLNEAAKRLAALSKTEETTEGE